MKFFDYRGYSQIVKNKNILCSCHWGSLYPENYSKGLKICKHIIDSMNRLKIESMKAFIK